MANNMEVGSDDIVQKYLAYGKSRINSVPFRIPRVPSVSTSRFLRENLGEGESSRGDSA